MKIFLDCLPCMLRQVLEAARMATQDEQIHETIVEEALEVLSRHRSYCCAPKMSEVMHAIVKKNTGIDDPYASLKARDIDSALRVEPFVWDFVFRDKSHLLQALKASATGNVMDSALYKDLNIEKCLKEELEKEFAVCDIQSFEKDCIGAKRILIIGDNAGETVFDKMLAEYLSVTHEIVYAVREEPIINDVTFDDALKTGMQNFAIIMSTGCASPGTVLESCTTEFQTLFNEVDVVISKGQGNFEALSEAPRKVYFLLKAKCHRIAEALDVELNAYVFKESEACPCMEKRGMKR